MALPMEKLRGISQFLEVEGKVVLAGIIAKMYLASPDPRKVSNPQPKSFLSRYRDLSSQAFTDTGISGSLVFVYDRRNFTLEFQLWRSLSRKKAVFVYECYRKFDYKRLNPDIHCFEIDDCVLGMAFADTDVADDFYEKVTSALRQFEHVNYTPPKPKVKEKPRVPEKTKKSKTGSFFKPQRSSKFNTAPSSNQKKTPPAVSFDILKPSKVVKAEKGSYLSRAKGNPYVNSKDSNKSGKVWSSFRKIGEKKEGTKTSNFFNVEKSRSKAEKGSQFRRKKTEKDTPVVLPTSSFVQSDDEEIEILQSPHHKNRGKATSVVLPPRGGRELSVNIDGSINTHNLSVELKKVFKKVGIKKRDLKDPVFSMALVRDIQKQEMMMTYKEKPEYRNFSENQLDEALDSKMDEYGRYLQDLEVFEHRKKAKEREVGLSKWEDEQAPAVAPRRRDKGYTMLRNHNQALLSPSQDNAFGELSAPPTPVRRLKAKVSPPPGISPMRKLPPVPRKHRNGSFEELKLDIRPPLPPPPAPRGSFEEMFPPPPIEKNSPLKEPEMPALEVRPKTIISPQKYFNTMRGSTKYLDDVKVKKNSPALVPGGLEMTMKRLNDRLKTKEVEDNLAKKLKQRLEQRRLKIQEDESDSDWSSVD